MTIKEQKKIFSRNLRKYMDLNQKTADRCRKGSGNQSYNIKHVVCRKLNAKYRQNQETGNLFWNRNNGLNRRKARRRYQ